MSKLKQRHHWKVGPSSSDNIRTSSTAKQNPILEEREGAIIHIEQYSNDTCIPVHAFCRPGSASSTVIDMTVV